ncbi:MAG TPA: hypothetical protein VKU41_24840, partial [Polyangiaceae bacterium]|nr:hypothetical protein [Polyangiaceae bacterium]
MGASAVVAVAISVASPASAQLRESIDRVADAWRAAGGAVVVDRTRFLNDDETMPVVVPDLPPAECTTAVILGARGIGFHVRVSDVSDEDPSKRIPSEAGAVSIEICGEPFPRRLLVTSDSGRGALETVLATSVRPLPALRAVLPERGGGGLTNAPEPGTLPALPPPDRRAQASEARARRDGFEVLPRASWPSGVDGAGAGEDTLAPGCHTLELFAVDPRAFHPGLRAKLDLDAEMRDALGDRLLARDRTDAPDARLAACVGEGTQVDVVFVGSPPGVPVLVTHWMQPLPQHLPTLWGSEARARMAHVLLTRKALPPPRDPIFVAQGGVGMTPVPVSLEPGGCYLA